MSNSINFNADGRYEVYEHFAETGEAMTVDTPFGEVEVPGLGERHRDYMSTIQETLIDLQSDHKEAIAALEKQIAECDDPVVEQQLKGQLGEMREAWTMIVNRPPGCHRELGEFQSMWQDRIHDMRGAITNAYATAQGVAGQGIEQAPPTMVRAPIATEARLSEDVRLQSTGLTAPGESSDGEYTDISDFDVEGMVNLMSTDPQAAMAELKNLNPEDRGIALQMINTRLQQMNQMFSMMSNIMKSLHDTAKAAINNMRV
jgi:hypothetical protein